MAGGINIGQALSLIGGVPVQPAGAKTIIEKLRAAKSMIPGDMGNLLSKVLSQGPGAILQNPLAAIQGQLQGQLGGLVSQVTGALGADGAGLVNALSGAGGLGSALSNLGAITNNLSGLTTPGAGQFGLLDAIGHVNIAGMLGASLPGSLGVNTIMGPLLMGDALGAMSQQLPGIVNAAISGAMPIPTAINQVAGMAAQINGVINASTTAFQTLQNAALPLAQVAAAVSMVASGPAELAPIINSVIQDQYKAEIQAAMDKQVEIEIEQESDEQL